MTIVVDSYSPIYVGDVGAKFAPSFAHDDGTAMDLTGATITSKMILTGYVGGEIDANIGTVKVCAGTWTIDDVSAGLAHYQYASTDVDTPGVWDIYITITIAGNPQHPDDGQGHVKTLTILPISS
jgi:hypothetical protein